MLKLSDNALGMLIAKYRSVLLNMLRKSGASVLIASSLFFTTPADVLATTYTIDSTISTGGNNYQTLAAFQTAINNGTVTLADGDTITIYNSDSSLNSGIGININSNANITVNFANTGSAMTIEPVSGKTVHFLNNGYYANTYDIALYAENVTFTGFTASNSMSPAYNGSVIYGKNITIGNEITFTGNYASNYGGVINGQGSVSIGNNNTFSGNKTGTSGYGGAIFSPGNVTIGNYNYFNTNNSYVGGAIASNGVTTIGDYNQFSSNATTWTGGAIFGRGDIYINDNNIFNNNSAYWGGGAVFAENGSSVSIGNNNQFTGNTANKGNGASVGHGGAIYARNSVTIGDKNKFDSNIAANNGGAIVAETGSVTIGDENKFTGNQAGGSGGAIYSYNGVTVGSDNEFSANLSGLSQAGVHGGAIYSYNGGVTVGNTNKFDSNNSTNNGGAIYSNNGGITVNNGNEFNRNQAANNGGAIYSNNGGFTVGNNNTFTYNSSSGVGGGGAIYATGKVTLSNDNQFTNNTAQNGDGGAIYTAGDVTAGGRNIFTNNTAKTRGGAIYAKNVTINGTASDFNDFDGNTAVWGGAIFASGGTVNTGDYTVFQNNITTNGGGGAIYANTSAVVGNGNTLNNNQALATASNNTGSGGAIMTAGTVAIGDNNEFSSNKADFNGGAISASSGVTVGDGNNFQFNKAGSTGGAIYTVGTVTLGGGNIFDTNTARLNGGVIYAKNVTITSVGNTFIGNTADNSGGAIYATGAVDTGNNNEFSGNEAANSGGAIYANNNIIIGSSNEFDGNVAFTGGAIYTESDVTLGSNNSFLNNVANTIYSPTPTSGSSNGGAIKFGRNLIIGGSNQFTGNTASDFGGAIYGGNGSVTIGDDNKFIVNQANEGGAISADNINIGNGNLFDRNVANDSGGAILAKEITIGNYNTFQGNLAVYYGASGDYRGGAIYAENVNIGGSNVFAGNKTNLGGAIYASNITITDSGNKFTSNIADDSGGAIYASGAIDTGNNNEFSGNKAAYSGGTIYADGTVTIGDDNTFDTNTADNSGGAIYANSDIIVGEGNDFKNNSTKQAGGAISTASNVIVGDHNTFYNNSTFLKGGAIFSRGKVTVGDYNTFDTNKVNADGGAIWAEDDVIVGDLNIFQSNRAGGYTGGAISASGNGSVTIGDGNKFIDNSAVIGSGGAIHSDNNVTIGVNNEFERSSALYGGAIHANGTVTVGDDNTFEFNTADSVGGAIYADSVNIEKGNVFTSNKANEGGAILAGSVTIGDDNTFQNNTAIDSGGAIYGSSNVFVNGGNTFTSNQATGTDSLGGAIWAGSVTLNTYDSVSDSSGDIVFQGNTADGKSNAIYAEGSLTLDAGSQNTIYFYDSVIVGDSNWGGGSVNINSDSLSTGTVLFDQYQSKIYGNTIVYGGTMHLTNGAAYGADSLAGSYSGSFELGTGATLLTDANANGNENSIKADSITFDSGSKLDFNMNKSKDKNGADATTNLSLEGANFSGQDIGAGTVDIIYTTADMMDNGTYTLVDVSGISSGTQLADDGELLYNGQGTFTDRRATAFHLENDNNKLLNLIVDDLLNTTVTWTNNDTQEPRYWDSMGSKNWDGFVKSKEVSQFLNGDSVKFDDTGAGSIVVDAKGVTITDNANGQFTGTPPIAGMTVDNSSGNDYTFSGGSIGGSGGLTKTGDGELTLNNANTYTGGTQLNGGKINIGNDQALGTNTLSMGNDTTNTTLGFDGNYTIANTININNNSIATFETKDGVNAVITGDINGGTTASTLDKTGAGTLTIGKANVTNANVEEGRLRIDNNKTLTVENTLELKSGTILGVGLNKAVKAGALIIGDDVTLNLNYLNSTPQPGMTSSITLIHSDADVTKHFAKVTIGGVDLTELVDRDEFFLDITVQRFDNQQDVVAEIKGLAWEDTVNNTAHGTFNVADNFTLDVNLIDNNTVPSINKFYWDGKTLTKTGAGILTLTGTNEYTGDTEINQGTLALASANSIGGSRGVTIGTNATAGALQFNYSDSGFNKAITLNDAGGAINTDVNNVTLTKEISGTGDLTKEGAGELTLTDDNGYSGDTKINQGTLALTGEDSIKNSNNVFLGTDTTTGTLKFNYGDDGFDKAITLNNAGGAIDTDVNDVTLEGIISGDGGLTKKGAGELILTQDNAYEGGTTINSGVLTAGTAGALGGGTVAVTNNATLSLNFATGRNFNNQLSGAGSLTTDGDISITNNNSGFSGDTLINSGALTLEQENALGGGTVTVTNNATLSLNFATGGNFNNQLSGAGSLTTDGDISISKNNSGFSGDTTINAGTLTLKNGTALGTGTKQVVGSNGALSLNYNGAFDNNLSGAGKLSIDGDISIDKANAGFTGTAYISTGKTATLGNIYALGDNNIVNYGTLDFSYKTPAQKNINIKSYSGNGIIGLQASLTSEAAMDKWVDKLSFESNPLNQVNVRFNFTNGSDLKYLSSDDTSMVFAVLSNPNNNADLFKLDNAYGLIGAKNLLIKNTNNKQTFYLGTEFNSSASKVYHEVAAASLSQAAVMHNRQLFDGFAQAIQHSKKNSPGIYIEGEKFNLSHGTGNNADIKGNTSAIAMAWEKDEKTAYGIFGQQFNGSYENSHEVTIGSDSQTVYSNGDLRYHVLGLFAHHRPEGQKTGDPGHYYEAVLKAGRAINEFKANNFQQRTSNFQIGQNILGFSLGGGYVKNSGKDNTAEYYGHLIYTKLGGNDTTDSIGQHININSADSVRMLTGARLNFNQNKKTTTYFGAALDYEFSGKAGVYIDGFEAESTKLKGLTGIMELGFKSNHGKDNSLSLEGALHGYVGKKRGLGGVLTLSKSF